MTEHFYRCSDPYRPGPSGEGDRTREKREGERHEPKTPFEKRSEGNESNQKVRPITIFVYSMCLTTTRCYRSVLSCPLGRGCVRLHADESILDIVGDADIENYVKKYKYRSGTKKKLKKNVVPKDDGKDPIKPSCHRDDR